MKLIETMNKRKPNLMTVPRGIQSIIYICLNTSDHVFCFLAIMGKNICFVRDNE